MHDALLDDGEKMDPQDDRRILVVRLSPALHRRVRVLAAAEGLRNAGLLARAIAALERELRARRARPAEDEEKGHE
jgi:hypothetical protein